MSIRKIFPIDNWNFQTESIFLHLEEGELHRLLAHQLHQEYEKGEIIFREGSFPTGIFYLQEGKVKKFKVDKEGKEQIIYVANTGELLGYHAVLGGTRHSDSAAALERSSVSFIPKEDFLETLEHSPLLNKRLLKALTHEFTVFTNSLSLFGQKTVRQRLALQLVLLREKYKVDHKEGEPVTINMSRDDLGSLVGTAKENVVRLLTELKDSGILETKGRKIIVHDVKQLLKIADY